MDEPPMSVSRFAALAGLTTHALRWLDVPLQQVQRLDEHATTGVQMSLAPTTTAPVH